MESDKKTIKVLIHRFNSSRDAAPVFKSYEIASSDGMTVMMLLRRIYREQDRTLAFRDYECYRGVCTACLMKVNGKNVKACSELVRPGQTIRIEPIGGYKVVRDLVVDFSVESRTAST